MSEYKVAIRNFVGRAGLRENSDPSVANVEASLTFWPAVTGCLCAILKKAITYVAMLYVVLGENWFKEERSIALLAVMKVIRPKLF